MITLLLTGSLPAFIFAQPVITPDDDPPCFEIEARVRNGNTGFEAALFTPTTPPPGQPGGGQWQMNPAGAPVWNTNGNSYGDIHSFLFTYIKSTGISIWNIDFNRDGDYTDPQESVTNTAPGLIGKSFKYINIYGQGHSSGHAASITNFIINGVNFGSFSSSSETAFSTLFEDESGLFGDISVTGNFTFSGDGGQERPRIWVRLGTINAAPVCNISHPADSSCWNVVDTIPIDVTTTDTIGVLLAVEFFDGANLLGVDSFSPYTFPLTGALPGSHILTAKAIDSYEAYTISSPVTIMINHPPICSITNPSDGAYYFMPDSIHLEADASDPDGNIIAVKFYAGVILLGADSVSPYSFTWQNPVPGVYSLTARAIDNKNGETSSMPNTIIVNAPPTCNIQTPVDGMIFYDPANIPFQVNATDLTDTVAMVEFFLDSVLIGSDNLSPFINTSLNNTPMGVYVLSAKSTDVYGVVTFSDAVQITVRCILEDLDNNGVVNTTDFLSFISVFGTNCTGCIQDFNEDGAINTIDFLRLLTVLGYSCN